MLSPQAKATIRRDMFVFNVFVLAVFSGLLVLNWFRLGMPLWPALVDAVRLTVMTVTPPAAALVALRAMRAQWRRG